MKKTVSIILLFVFLSANTEAHQLLKLPFLVEHYLEHKHHNNNISFFDFLNMHYVMADDGDGDTPEDMQLPFKSDNACGNICSIGFVSQSNYQLAIKAVYTENELFNNHSVEFISSAFLSSIWQPPKSC